MKQKFVGMIFFGALVSIGAIAATVTAYKTTMGPVSVVYKKETNQVTKIESAVIHSEDPKVQDVTVSCTQTCSGGNNCSASGCQVRTNGVCTPSRCSGASCSGGCTKTESYVVKGSTE